MLPTPRHHFDIYLKGAELLGDEIPRRWSLDLKCALQLVTRFGVMSNRVLQPPHEIENFIVATSTLAQVGGFAQKPFWSSFVKICQCLGVAQ